MELFCLNCSNYKKMQCKRSKIFVLKRRLLNKETPYLIFSQEYSNKLKKERVAPFLIIFSCIICCSKRQWHQQVYTDDVGITGGEIRWTFM